jgi:sugar lactone lactonase YvrE
MPQTARTFRRILHHYATLLASVVLFFAHAYGIAQNLKSVPVIYNYPLIANGLPEVINNPAGMAVDAHGNLYIVDNTHYKVFKVDTFRTVTLLAGTGQTPFKGDGGLAIEANLNNPSAVAVDVDGNVFIADTFNYAVRRVDAITGIITTVAGGHGQGYTGDNGPGASAKIGEPASVAVDSAGNVYISDRDNKVIRKVSAAGIITTFAGGGTPASGNGDGGPAIAAKFAPAGIALDASGNLYIADPTAAVVRRVDTTNTITTFAGSTPGAVGTVPSGLATSAKLVTPVSLATDSSGNVYIVDTQNGMVSVVDTTNTITVLAGLGPYGGASDGSPAAFFGGFGASGGVAVDYLGNVYFNSSSGDQIYKVVTHPERFPFTKVGQTSSPQRIIIENKGPSTIAISSVVPSGDFHFAPVSSMENLPCTSSSNDSLLGNGTVLSWCTIDLVFTPTAAGIRSAPLTITSNDTTPTTTVTLTSTGMNPTVAVSGGVVYTVAGEFPDNSITNRNDNVPATTANLVEIDGITFDSAGNVFFSEYGTSDVRRVDAKTGIISTVVGDVTGLTAGPATGDGGPATKATLDGVGEILYGPDGTMYVVDGLNHEIRTVDTSGIIHRFAGTGASGCPTSGDSLMAINVAICSPTGIAMDAAGNLYYSNGLANSIHKITPGGVLSTIAGVYGSANAYSGDMGPALSAHLNNPWNLVVDSKGNIFFNDEGNEVVRRIDATTKVITTVVGIGTQKGYSGDGGLATNANLSSPFGLGIDAADNLYIADSGNNVIRKVDSSTQIITTVAGNNIIGDLYNGNGIPATAAGINHPESVAVDAAGDIFYGDDNGLLRVVSPNGLIDFGNQALNTTSNFQSVSVSNIGNMPLHFDATTPYAIDGDFTFTPGGTCDFTQPLAVGSSCTVHVLFTPSIQYERYGTLNLNDDGTGTPQVTQLRGNGVIPALSQAALAPNPLIFPGQTVNTTSTTQIMTLSNPGTSTLNITGISLAGANPTNFTILSTESCGSAVGAGGSCSIVVSFTPSSATSFTATVVVADDAPNSPQSATVTGNGLALPAPLAVLTPAGGLTFSSTIGTPTTQTFTLTNPGNATLNITGFTVGGTSPASFIASATGSSACGSTLSAGAQCTISVSFTPTSTTTLTANLSVADNAANTPQLGLLSGSGTVAVATPDFTIAATPPSASIVGGASAQYTINLASLSGELPFTSQVTLTASGLPSGATATFAPPSAAPGGGGASSTLTIQTVKSASLEKGPLDDHSTAGIVSFAFLFFSFLGLRKHRHIPRLLVVVFALILGGIGAATLSGCGGGYALPSTTTPSPTPKTYTITVTGTSAAIQHSTTVTLTVN